ncbi:MAG: hypothetical protein DMG63_14300 [Acidobacteria bacterium]|nr:MAG: hypothetical protein DMG63_14300 [Acidobacteriota bacterium]
MVCTAVAFGTFEFDPRTGELRKRGIKLGLQPKSAAVLSVLVRHPHELVTREHLRIEVWGLETFVDFENGLGNAIWKLRQHLGDKADNPLFIESIPGKGYRFIADVHPVIPNPNSRKVIAIRPFEDLDNRQSDDYFVAGLTEELITQLGRLNPKRLAVVALLMVELLPVKKEHGRIQWTESLVAYELYLQGRYHWNKRVPKSTFTAIEYFQRAIAADPEYALAHVGLADCFGVLGFYGELAPADAFGRAKQHASRALALDDCLAEAHSCLAFCLLQFDWDWNAAQHEHLQAIQLNSNCAPAHHWYGLTLTETGRFSDALRSLIRAKELDPFNPAIEAHIGRLAYFCRDFERSLKEVERAVELDRSYVPGRYFQAIAMVQKGNGGDAINQFEGLVTEFYEHPILVSGLAYAYGKGGKRAAALKAIDRLQALARKIRVPPYFLAFAHAGVENSVAALDYLDRAKVERFAWLHYLKMDPVFDFLRSNARFDELM